MMKSMLTAVIVSAALLALSCAATVSHNGESGKIKIDVVGLSARAFEAGWPDGGLPSFSSIAAKVSASDMSTVTVTGSSSSTSLTLQVPAGSGRLVEIVAVPAAGSTAPYFAKAYAGSATVDIGAGETKNVPITLSVSETKILLPSIDSYLGIFRVFTAASLTSGVSSAWQAAVYLDEYSDFEFDEHGRLLYSDAEMGVARATTLSDPAEAIPDTSGFMGLAYQSTSGLLFSPVDFDTIAYTNASGSNIGTIILSETIAISLPLIAADAGALYVPTMSEALIRGAETTEFPLAISKLSLSGTTLTDVVSVPFSALGLATEAVMLMPTDMIVKDGVLYIAAVQIDARNDLSFSTESYSRGKIIAVSTATMTKLWETGWVSSESDRFPTDSRTQLYGPRRFVAIAPKKLYVFDEGFYIDPNLKLSPGTIFYPYKDVDRVAEIDLESHTISNTGLDGAVSYIDAFAGIYIENPGY